MKFFDRIIRYVYRKKYAKELIVIICKVVSVPTSGKDNTAFLERNRAQLEPFQKLREMVALSNLSVWEDVLSIFSKMDFLTLNVEQMLCSVEVLVALMQKNHPWIHKRAETILTQLTTHPQLGELIQRILFIRNHIPSFDIDFKKIGHNFAIPSTGFDLSKLDLKESEKSHFTEGWNPLKAIEFMRMCIHYYVMYLEKKVLDQNKLEDLSDIIQRFKAMTTKLNYKAALNRILMGKNGEFLPKLMQDFDNLSQGESILLPGGWRTKGNLQGVDSNHTMLYEIEKTTPDFVTWRIYNTGAGIRNHPYNKHLKKYQTVIEVLNIPRSEMTSDFFNKLLSLRQEGYHSLKKEDCIKTIYGLIDLLKQKGARTNETINHWQSKQKFGFCTWKVLKSFLKFKLPSAIFEEFKQFVDISLLLSIQSNNGQNISFPDTAEFKAMSEADRQVIYQKALTLVQNKFHQRVFRKLPPPSANTLR